MDLLSVDTGTQPWAIDIGDVSIWDRLSLFSDVHQDKRCQLFVKYPRQQPQQRQAQQQESRPPSRQPPRASGSQRDKEQGQQQDEGDEKLRELHYPSCFGGDCFFKGGPLVAACHAEEQKSNEKDGLRPGEPQRDAEPLGHGVAWPTKHKYMHAVQNWIVHNFARLGRLGDGMALSLGFHYSPCDRCFWALSLLARRLGVTVRYFAVRRHKDAQAQPRWEDALRQQQRRLENEGIMSDRDMLHPVIVFSGNKQRASCLYWLCKDCKHVTIPD